MATSRSRKRSSDSDNSDKSPLSEAPNRPSKDVRFKRPPTPDSGSRRSTRKRSADQMLEDDHEDGDRNDGGHSRDSSTSDICLCQPDPRIPRPRNAFILYRQHHHPGIVSQSPSLTNPEISIIVGEQWKRESAEVKRHWKELAEEEKVRHQQQYPEYKYQPRRNSRRASTDDSPTSATYSGRCQRCGGRTMVSPTTPQAPASGGNTTLPPLYSFTGNTTNKGPYLPMVNNLSLEPPRSIRRNSRPPPPNISVAQMSNFPDEDRFMPMSGDAKRRRYTSAAAHIPPSNRPAINSPYPLTSPYREALQRQSMSGLIPQQPLPSLQRHMSLRHPQQLENGTSQSPGQNSTDQGKSVEAMVMSIPILRKIAILGRISPPFKQTSFNSSSKASRGAVIAIEGDDSSAVKDIVDWFEDGFKKSENYHVRVLEGPKESSGSKELSITEYHSLIMEWKKKEKEMIDFITSSGTEEQSRDGSAADEKTEKGQASSTSTPVVLLNQYQLHGSNMYACRIPIRDHYSPVDHWQWMATLWRDIIGPDMTIYVKDASPEEMAREKIVEIREEIKCIVLRRQKGSGPLHEKVEEKNLRRLGFEISEWVRSVGEVKQEVERRGS